MADPAGTPNALVVAMPERHLEAAATMPDPIVLPAGSPGDLDRAELGWPVLLIPIGDEGAAAVRWRAEFLGRVAFEPGEPFPSGLPSTWLHEHHLGARSDPATLGTDDDGDDGDEGGPQSFFEVSGLARLPRSEWIFANELVPKQQRLGRSFLPRAPRAIAFRDESAPFDGDQDPSGR
jgi:hypothetical protein